MTLPVSSPRDERPIRPEHLQAFGERIEAWFGLAHPKRNRETLERRFRAVARATGIADPSALVQGLEHAGPDSLLYRTMAELVPNRETSFFRDEEQLSSLYEELRQRQPTGASGPIRILSAGCSTGEEVYSLAMLSFENMHHFWGRSFAVHGLDLSERALERARSGVYPASKFEKAGAGPKDWVPRYFRPAKDGFVAKSFLRSVVSFRQANLVDEASLAGLCDFDAVVCRNVLIYFDPPALQETVSRLLSFLRPGGILLLGHAEAGFVSHLDQAHRKAGEHAWLIREEEL